MSEHENREARIAAERDRVPREVQLMEEDEHGRSKRVVAAARAMHAVSGFSRPTNPRWLDYRFAEVGLEAADRAERPVVERLSSALENIIEAFYMRGTPNDDDLPEAIAKASAVLAESNQPSSQPANDGATVRVIDAADVRDLLRIAYEARDRADGGLVVITPELALSIADCLRAALAESNQPQEPRGG